LQENAEAGSKLMRDEASDSQQVDAEFEHEFVNHQVEYVRGDVHRNGVESFWVLLQRTLRHVRKRGAVPPRMSRRSASTNGKTTTAGAS
jgi:hypothetical protein